MTTGQVLAVVAAAIALAFANGANDNGKGVATLVGSGRLTRRTALFYAAVTTFLGSAAALVLARGLLARFSGKGILSPEIVDTPATSVAVATAAAVTVLLATRMALPVSTTHALVGALAGVGVVSGTLHGAPLTTAFLGPLLLSPPLALAATAVAYPALRRLRLALGISHGTCVCLAADPVAVDASRAAGASFRLVQGDAETCSGYTGSVAGIRAQQLLDGSHLLTAGAVSFARGVNDTPKIAALMLLAAPFGAGGETSLLLVGLVIAAGGLLGARTVTSTMSHGITAMNDGQAFTANLATALMVLVASRFGLPVSTTHVSVGALFGIGAVNGSARWKTIGAVLLSWVVILPLSALLSGGIWAALGR